MFTSPMNGRSTTRTVAVSLMRATIGRVQREVGIERLEPRRGDALDDRQASPARQVAPVRRWASVTSRRPGARTVTEIRSPRSTEPGQRIDVHTFEQRSAPGAQRVKQRRPAVGCGRGTGDQRCSASRRCSQSQCRASGTSGAAASAPAACGRTRAGDCAIDSAPSLPSASGRGDFHRAANRAVAERTFALDLPGDAGKCGHSRAEHCEDPDAHDDERRSRQPRAAAARRAGATASAPSQARSRRRRGALPTAPMTSVAPDAFRRRASARRSRSMSSMRLMCPAGWLRRKRTGSRPCAAPPHAVQGGSLYVPGSSQPFPRSLS